VREYSKLGWDTENASAWAMLLCRSRCSCWPVPTIRVLSGTDGDDRAIGISVKDDRPCESEIAPRPKSSLQVPSSQRARSKMTEFSHSIVQGYLRFIHKTWKVSIEKNFRPWFEIAIQNNVPSGLYRHYLQTSVMFQFSKTDKCSKLTIIFSGAKVHVSFLLPLGQYPHWYQCNQMFTHHFHTVHISNIYPFSSQYPIPRWRSHSCHIMDRSERFTFVRQVPPVPWWNSEWFPLKIIATPC
jgi:hypothetical protein